MDRRTREYNELSSVEHRPRLEWHYFQDMKENFIAMDPTTMEPVSVVNGTLCKWCCRLLEERLFNHIPPPDQNRQICLDYWREIESSSKRFHVCSIIWDMVQHPSNSNAADYRAEWVCLVFRLIQDVVGLSKVSLTSTTTIRVSARIQQPDNSSFELKLGYLRMIPTKQQSGRFSILLHSVTLFDNGK